MPIVLLLILIIAAKLIVTKVADAKGAHPAGWAAAAFTLITCGFLIVFARIQAYEAEKQAQAAIEAQAEAQRNLIIAQEAQKEASRQAEITRSVQIQLEKIKN